MDSEYKPQTFKGLDGILQAFARLPFRQFLLKTLKLDWVAFLIQ